MKKIITIPGWGFSAIALKEIWPNSMCLTCEDLFNENTHSPLEILKNATESFNSEPYTIAAWSLGGLVALDYCSTFKDPRINLILLSPTSNFTYSNKQNFEELSVLQSSLDLSRDNALSRFYLKLLRASNKTRSEIFNTISIYRNDSVSLSTYSLNSALNYLKIKDVSNQISEVKNPCLIIHGGKDNLIPISHSEVIHQSLLNSTLKILPNASHLLPFDNKNEILEFIKENALSNC